MVEDLILSVLHLTLLIDFSQSLDKVLIVEFLELLELDDTILIDINLIEERPDLMVLDGQVEEAREADVEVSQAQVTSALIIHMAEGLLHLELASNLLLDGSEHLDALRLLIELTLDLAVRL